MNRTNCCRGVLYAALLVALLSPMVASPTAEARDDKYLFNDAHFHLTNYIQRGTDIHKYLEIMGDQIGRSTLFGIPLQQTWSYQNSANFAPTYYLESDAPLYYYSYTDAVIAHAYLSLSKAQQARLEPMITGFNPADMYAADHIRRVLEMFPGVFTGIGEFTIHKEFVSSKVAGNIASLTNPAMDTVLNFAGETGLLVIIHNDLDMPFAKDDKEPIYLTQMKDLLARHSSTSIIWAHTGLGRVVHPPGDQATEAPSHIRPPRHFEIVESILDDPRFSHVNFDISWDEVAKYAIATPESIKKTAALLDRHPDRFLFGTDTVAPKDKQAQLSVFHMWDPIFALVQPETKEKILKGNFNRLFDAAAKKVRAWEKANIENKKR